MVLYTDYISSFQLAEEIEELIGKRLLIDTPRGNDTPDVLIAMVYYACKSGSLKVPQGGENICCGQECSGELLRHQTQLMRAMRAVLVSYP